MLAYYSKKLALVTGASSGIGREIVLQLISHGARVVATARRTDRLQSLQNECGQDQCEFVAADLTKTDDQQKISKLIAERNVDIVINNAGRGSFGQFDKLELNDELAMLHLNIEAFLTITHAALKHFRLRGHGALLGVSSIAAFQPLPFLATYAATKAFEYQLYRGLRAELIDTPKIFISSLNPGPVATEFAGVARVPGTATGFSRDDVKMVARIALEGLARNKALIVPGWYASMMALGSSLLPVSLSSFFLAKSLRAVLDRTNKTC